MRWIWAAYSKGALASMGEQFKSGEMEPAEFKDAFGREVLENYSAGWTLFADDKRVGLVLGFYPHPKVQTYMIVGDMIWFPWASPRIRIEAAVRFFSELRHTLPFVEYAKFEYKRFFDVIAAHGIMRRVGTSQVIYPGEPTAIYETRQ